MPSEADARIKIDRLLREAGWDIEDKAQVSTEEAAADGRADYLLKNTRTQPLCVLEAKRFTADPYSAKAQAKEYAESIPVPFVILSNGADHYFWDLEDGDARPILGFPTQTDLERRANTRQHRKGSLQNALNALPLPEKFRFKGEEIEARPYQLECLKAVDKALIAGRRRMLLELATGAGKTLIAAMLIKRWLQAAVVSRVLFLADRIELAKQAKWDTFDDYLAAWPRELLFHGKKSLQGQIVVGTLDTIAGQLGQGGFGNGYFDLVITDECHRSIYNIHRATLAHFDAVHIGLTATPNPGELRLTDEAERQLVKNTYMFFDCWNSATQEGTATFSYDLQRGIKEHYLANYKIYVAQSKLTFEGALWNDEQIQFSDWGRTAESEDRLRLQIEEFFRLEEECSQDHPKKTIVFAVGEKQAVLLERLFNQLLPDATCLRIAQQFNLSPAIVRQNYAKKITCYSNNGNPKTIIDEFKYDPLPLIAVSVDMLDTGYDHKEVENLVMMRPTASAMKYSQMRGRGNRLAPKLGKTEFLIYDFVDNTARFNDPAAQYHKPKEVNGGGPRPAARIKEDEKGKRGDFVHIPAGSLHDEFRSQQLIIVGPAGLEMDKKTYCDRWQERIQQLAKQDPAVSKIFQGEELTDEEWDELAHKLDSPELFFSEETLRKAFEQPTGSLSDFIRSALGKYRFPTRHERIERAFETWVAEHSSSINPEQSQMLRMLRNVVLANAEDESYRRLDTSIFTRAPFSLRGGRAKMEQLFGKDGLTRIVDELNGLLAI
jgi:type I restriction enzyme R subunit